jgi:hypothetical protein
VAFGHLAWLVAWADVVGNMVGLKDVVQHVPGLAQDWHIASGPMVKATLY